MLVAMPEGMYLYASNKVMLHPVKSTPRMAINPNCFQVMRICFFATSMNANINKVATP